MTDHTFLHHLVEVCERSWKLLEGYKVVKRCGVAFEVLRDWCFDQRADDVLCLTPAALKHILLEDRLHSLDDDEVEALEVAIDYIIGEESSLFMTCANLNILHELLHET